MTRWRSAVALSACVALWMPGALGAQARPPGPSARPEGPATVTVVIETTAGSIEAVIETAKAPSTSANFLRYVDEKRYDGGRFHRAVRMDNQVRQDVKIEVIQGGRGPTLEKAAPGFGPIALERTTVTGLRHVEGTLSMARDAADTATSDFFVCIGDQPALDFGGARHPDGQGFAAFGRVVSGMDVVRRIQAGATNDREALLAPVEIRRVYRK